MKTRAASDAKDRGTGARQALLDLPARVAGLGPVRRWAAGASLVWTVVVLGYAIGFFAASHTRGTVFLDGAYFLVTLVLPLLLVSVVALLAEELLRQRAMVEALADRIGPLIDALDATRGSLAAQGPLGPDEVRKAVQGALMAGRAADPTPALDRLATGQARIEVALRALAERAPAPKPEPVTATAEAATFPSEAPLQPEPAAEPEAMEPLLDWPTLVRALDFPRDADDDQGFAALRIALRERSLAQMLQAAEDVLTLLSQEGVYVDDLPMEPVDAAAWRRFMAGARGSTVACVGGIADPAALETALRLTRQDTIFRDTALFFQRRFDVVLNEMARDASDPDLACLVGTRSGRAFQLMARASGSFD